MNVTKTKHMIIKSALESRKQIVMNSELMRLIEKVNSLKYLERMIASYLNFKDHLSFVQKKGIIKKCILLGNEKQATN